MTADTLFDRAIAAMPVHGAPGQYAVTFSEDWNAPAGPNGGYLAAMVLNAMMLALDEPSRVPRTLTKDLCATIPDTSRRGCRRQDIDPARCKQSPV